MAPFFRRPTPPNRQPDPDLLSLTEAARLLRVAPGVVWTRVEVLPVSCIVRDTRGDIRFKRDELVRWMLTRPLERETAERIAREKDAAARRASTSVPIVAERLNPLRRTQCPICHEYRPSALVRFHAQEEHAMSADAALELFGKEDS